MDQPKMCEHNATALDFAGVLRDYLATPMLAVDSEGLICGSTPDLHRLIQLPSPIMGQSIQTLPPPLRGLIHESFAGNPVFARDLTLEGADGTPKQLSGDCIACPVEHGRSFGAIVLLRDLTSIRKIGSTMQRLDRLASIGTLSASMAHEIKNALVAVTTFVGDLVERNKDSELAALVSRELRRVDVLVSQMLKFAGPASPTFSLSGVHRLLDRALQLIQPQIDTRQISLHRSFAAPSDLVTADEYHLEQAFLNVLLNAITAMESHGRLSVATHLVRPDLPAGTAKTDGVPAFVEIQITDTGKGIASEDLSRVFEPFFSTKPQGTGLGLAITRRIISEHHGTITVESELEKGTTFRISLPLASSET